VNNGAVSTYEGYTKSEERVRQMGKLVNVYVVITKSSALGTSENVVGAITGVNPPNETIRFGCNTGAAAYSATKSAYASIAADGTIRVTANNSTDTVCVLNLTYFIY
jgi:hypothetical protein